MPIINCIICGKEKHIMLSYSKRGMKCCSNKCAGISRKGIIQSKETIEKRVSKLRGRPKPPISDKTRLKMSKSHKGVYKPWLYTKEAREKLVKSLTGNPKLLGRKHSIESKNKISASRIGSKNPNWRGGKTPINEIIRCSKEMKEWRKSIFERDNYTCQICGARNGNGKYIELQADHIKPFAYFPELRFDLNNGRTLCIGCHRKTESFGWGAYHKRRGGIFNKCFFGSLKKK